jgi:aminopeptidase-like protein
LAALPDRRYSYRFLFGPEYFGAAAYLAKAAREDIAAIRYGVYCDMLSVHEPFGWQSTFRGGTMIDLVLENVVKTHCATSIQRPYRQLWGNDEMFFNGPGINIPMAGVGRGMCREYHYDCDNPSAVDGYHLVESLWILERVIEVFETNRIPVRKFTGPVCLNRHGLYFDATEQPELYRAMEAIQILMDGQRSILDLAHATGTDFFFLRDLLRRFEERGLIELCLPASS